MPTQEIDDGKLREVWSAAKKKAGVLAKAAPDKKLFDKLDSDDFVDDFGPDLAKWFKGWPNYNKIAAEKVKLDKTITKYRKAVAEAKKSGLSDPVVKCLNGALTDIGEKLDTRLKAAEESIGSNVDLALKDSVAGKAEPISLFYNVDIAKAAAAKCKIANEKFDFGKILITIVLGDEKILEKIPLDDGLLAQKMYEAADYKKIIDDVASALDDIAKGFKDGSNINKANDDFDKKLEEILADAADRASVPVVKLSKARVDRRNYKISKTFKIGAMVAGIGVSIASLATAPFTGGASGVLSIIGIVQSAKSLFDEVRNLARSAEATADKLATELMTLMNQYKTGEDKVSNDTVGAGELGKTVINTIVPGIMTTISGCKDLTDSLEIKVKGIVTNSHDVSTELGKALTKQAQVQKDLNTFETSAEKVFSKDQLKSLTELIKKNEEFSKTIGDLVDKTSTLNGRAEATHKKYEFLSKYMNEMAAREPTWSKFSQSFVKALAAAGFMAGGNINAPDASAMLKQANDVLTGLSNGLGSASSAKDLITDVGSIIKEVKAKK